MEKNKKTMDEIVQSLPYCAWSQSAIVLLVSFSTRAK
jgi:hypothetical protein